jgi:hypothetical protein
MAKILILIILFFSQLAFGEINTIELFPAVDGAKSYQVILTDENQLTLTKDLATPHLETEGLSDGLYRIKVRYQKQNGKWSKWSNSANLRIVKKEILKLEDVEFKAGAKPSTTINPKIPFSLGLGYLQLKNETKTGGNNFNTNNSTYRLNGLIQMRSYKLNLIYDQSSFLTRLDASLSKQINSFTRLGASLWLGSYETKTTTVTATKDLVASYSHLFATVEMFKHFDERWMISTKAGLGNGVSYFIRPELSYSAYLSENLSLISSLNYEQSLVKQPSLQMKLSGWGLLLHVDYLLEV